MQLRDVMSRAEVQLQVERLPSNLVIVDEQIGIDFQVIDYLQPDTGSELSVHIDTKTGHVDLAVLHLFGQGFGIDLV